MAKEILEWRDEVLSFLNTIKVADDKKVKLKRTAADLVHEIGYFLDHQLKDFPGSLTAVEQLAIAAAVIENIRGRLEA